MTLKSPLVQVVGDDAVLRHARSMASLSTSTGPLCRIKPSLAVFSPRTQSVGPAYGSLQFVRPGYAFCLPSSSKAFKSP